MTVTGDACSRFVQVTRSWTVNKCSLKVETQLVNDWMEITEKKNIFF